MLIHNYVSDSGTTKKPVSARWSSRSFRRQRALSKDGNAVGQAKITHFFNPATVSSIIDDHSAMRENLNQVLGNDKTASVKPILLKMFANAEKNNEKQSMKGHRHDEAVKKFASSLLCLMGKASYEMLQSNLGNALPSVSTLQRNISSMAKIKEGEFRFNELIDHLNNWNAPMGVHLALDDTRILKKVEYDPVTGRFVGFCLPLNDGIPVVDTFILQTFEQIEDTYNSTSIVTYAHCIVAKPVCPIAPSFVLFLLGTDSKYTHIEITKRLQIIKSELWKHGVKVYSNGADGAGPFLKAMMIESNLFKTAIQSNIPESWTFYLMPTLKSDSLSAQDLIHLLAKLRTRLIIPSNIISIGSEVACRGHLTEILKKFPKAKHGLTYRAIDDKDKQNYASIELLVKPSVQECLKELDASVKTQGTVVYLNFMRDIRDSVFDKSLSPLRRLYLIWKSAHFVRIWRCWLEINNLSQNDHFITNNAYLCLELNAHMILNLVYNVIIGVFPKDTLRIWMSGSQSCEQLFRILRSMTPTFSTIVNFSLKGILEKVHKLQFLSSSESDDTIVFPRVKRRLLQLKEESDATFSIPTIDQVTKEILKAKKDAMQICHSCGIQLESYDDLEIVKNVQNIIEEAVANDYESEEIRTSCNENVSTISDNSLSSNEVIMIQEDLSHIKLMKSSSSSFPVYEKITDATLQSKGKTKTYELLRKTSPKSRCLSRISPFVLYKETYIRKSTALYLLQENFKVSSDRLLRVRAEQPSHIFSGLDMQKCGPMDCVRAGELCVFRRVDCKDKYLLGRIIQFSYMQGSKRERQYSSDFVDLTKNTYKDVGVLANWFQGTRIAEEDLENVVSFKPMNEIFTPGYLSLEYYCATINDSSLNASLQNSFTLSQDVLKKVIPRWQTKLTFDIN